MVKRGEGGVPWRRSAAPSLQMQPEEPVVASCGATKTAPLTSRMYGIAKKMTPNKIATDVSALPVWLLGE